MLDRRGSCVCLMLVLAAACGGSSSSAGLCSQLPGSGFVAENQATPTNGPDDGPASSDELDFSDDEVDWWSGDTVETGTWSCADDEVAWLAFFRGELAEEDGVLVINQPDGTRWRGPTVASD
ncbi:MAG: hypothetical protein AAGA99_21505 [Actinomycetota bacterium]